MDTSVVIGRLFGISCSLGSIGGVSGAKSGQTIGKTEYSGLLSGLNEVALTMAFAKYGLDEGAKRQLLAFSYDYACDLARCNRWDCTDFLLESIVKLAVSEVLGDSLCANCNGTGLDHSRVCKSCGGSGKRCFSGRDRAKQLGLNQSQWWRLWSARYDDVFTYVNQLDSEVLSFFHKLQH